VNEASLAFYRTPGPMTALPDHPALTDVPSDLDALRRVVQGLLVHRDWAPAYGVEGDAIRFDEQNIRSTTELLVRALEICDEPVTVPRAPVDRVLSICRHFTLLHTALLRSFGAPARVRCGFSNYFDRTKWYDHWITERWNGTRWVREDPQIDELQAGIVHLDFDPYDQPPGQFLSAGEAWIKARAGEVDPMQFGIFDMFGLWFIAGNVVLDFACLNKVELLPWDGWGMMTGPYEEPSAEAVAILDDIAALSVADDVDAIRARYEADDRLRVPPDITSFINGELVEVHLDLD
jgi:hypothetical protein